MSDNIDQKPDLKEQTSSENEKTSLLLSATVALVCIALLSGYAYLAYEFDIPSEASLIIGLFVTAIFWKHRKTSDLLNGLFTCGVVISGISAFASLLNWFALR